jgi:hypothetical protein
MSLINKDHNTKNKRVLKRSKTGLEVEFHTIDNKGYIVNEAEYVISALQGMDEKIDVTKEIGSSMVEFGCYPDVMTYNPINQIIASFEKAIEVCKEKGLRIYPFGTYPGSFTPVISTGDNYKTKLKIFGEEKTNITMRVVGFHHHYTLPKGVFDYDKKVIKLLKHSKIERSMISSYNFEIAADPVLTLFTQSSPFYQGQKIAKDSRMIVYRGGKKLRYIQGAYGKLQLIGGLPPYKQTATDLMSSLVRKQMRWKKIIKKANPDCDFDKLYPYKLDIGWNPVKINKHGTLEQRGMDMNLISVIAAVTVLLKQCLKTIQREFIEVIPADFGIDQPFRFDKGILYVPPHTYVRNKLQAWSAYKGFENDELYRYAKRFLSFAKSLTPKRYIPLIKIIETMINEKMSVSDQMIDYAIKKRWIKNNEISDSNAAKLALHFSKLFEEDLIMTKKIFEKILIY